MKTSDIGEIVNALHEAGIPPRDMDPKFSRLIIEVLRSVENGKPVPPEQVKEMASNLKLTPDEATKFIDNVTERDDDGNVVGTFGLSQKDYSHSFEVNGHVLSTWCAWDSLFLPALLKQTAKVESRCPQTKEKIYLTIAPDKVEKYEPTNAVVSIVLPKPTEGAPRSAGDIWMIFCSYVFYFVSAEAAIEWFKGKEYDPEILSIKDGHQLGLMTFEELLKYV